VVTLVIRRILLTWLCRAAMTLRTVACADLDRSSSKETSRASATVVHGPLPARPSHIACSIRRPVGQSPCRGVPWHYVAKDEVRVEKPLMLDVVQDPGLLIPAESGRSNVGCRASGLAQGARVAPRACKSTVVSLVNRPKGGWVVISHPCGREVGLSHGLGAWGASQTRCP
jgi:hypothetical protein